MLTLLLAYATSMHKDTHREGERDGVAGSTGG